MVGVNYKRLAATDRLDDDRAHRRRKGGGVFKFFAFLLREGSSILFTIWLGVFVFAPIDLFGPPATFGSAASPAVVEAPAETNASVSDDVADAAEADAAGADAAEPVAQDAAPPAPAADGSEAVVQDAVDAASDALDPAAKAAAKSDIDSGVTSGVDAPADDSVAVEAPALEDAASADVPPGDSAAVTTPGDANADNAPAAADTAPTPSPASASSDARAPPAVEDAASPGYFMMWLFAFVCIVYLGLQVALAGSMADTAGATGGAKPMLDIIASIIPMIFLIVLAVLYFIDQLALSNFQILALSLAGLTVMIDVFLHSALILNIQAHRLPPGGQ